MKRFLMFMASLAFVIAANAQTDPMKTSGFKTLEDGTLVTTTDQALLNMSLTNEVDFSMRSDARNGVMSYYFVMGIPYKAIDIASDATLDLTLGDGAVLRLPVERAMTWSKDKITVVNGSKSADVLRIPYAVTEEQISTVLTKGVKSVMMVGLNRTVSFNAKGNTFKNILSSQYTQLTSLSGGQASKDSEATILRDNIGVKITPSTKYFDVNNLDRMELWDCNDGYYIAYNRSSYEAVIFDSSGSATGRIKLNSDFEPRFDNGKAIVHLPDFSGWAIIDVHGNIVRQLEKYGRYTNLHDGIALYSANTGFEQVALSQMVDYAYIDSNGDSIYTDKAFRYYAGNLKDWSRDLSEGLRGYFDGKNWGFMDSNGKTAIIPKYYQVSDFSDGFAAVCVRDENEELWGFIDKKGDLVIEPKFSNKPDDFSCGYTIVKKKNGTYVFVDKQGKTVSDEFYRASRLANGSSIIQAIEKGLAAHEYLILDSTLKRITSVPSDTQNMGEVLFCSDKDVVFTLDGNYLWECESIDEMKHGAAWCRTRSPKGSVTKGLVNVHGEWILILRESEF